MIQIRNYSTSLDYNFNLILSYFVNTEQVSKVRAKICCTIQR